MDPHMYHYATVSTALEELKEKGFTVDFNNQEGRIINSPHDFTIVHLYYYEGESDPGDEATVYGIKSSTGEKGVFVAGHQAYTENSAAMVLNELSIKNKKDPEQNPEMNADCDESNKPSEPEKKEAVKLIDHL
ncbi:hypothetical protein [Flavobacterium wongokense]|uniref:hypothetical protein n=1 Tax=Flavobacterium wongokense TaxID=2910674 RepID=UPI00351D2C7A